MTLNIRGRPMTVCPNEVIGRHILHFGLFDLLVCEAITRLAQTGEWALDIGANIGFMTRVMADAVGPTGKVIAFEPHPVLFAELSTNCPEDWIDLRQVAVSAESGVAHLHVPGHFSENHGLSSLEASPGASEAIEISTLALETILPAGQAIGVVKMDIEGHEFAALQGAQTLLIERRIRDIIFEEHNIGDSGVIPLLVHRNYHVFRLEKGFFGPRIHELDELVPETGWESPCFLATIDPDRARRIFASGGWRALRQS